jgi:hypothetical protein
MTRTPQASGAAQTARSFAKDDRVRVRAGVTGGAAGGDEGVVRSVLPLGSERPVRVALDGDDGEPRGFEADELELVRAAAR